MNFASLDNDNLFAAPQGAGQTIGSSEKFGKELHDHFVTELRKSSVRIPMVPKEGEKEIKLPKDCVEVHYHAPNTMFPTLEDLQGSPPLKDGQEQSLQAWIDEKMQKLGSAKEMHLHPHATHFIFFEEKGFARGGGQVLPWNAVDEFRNELTEVQGSAEGLLILNGDQTDFNRAAATIAQSNPVIAFKTCGGASEQLSMLIDQRHMNDKAIKRGDGSEEKPKPEKRGFHCMPAGPDLEEGAQLIDDPDTVQDESKGESPDDFPVRGRPYEKTDMHIEAFDDKVVFDGSIDRALAEELIVIDLNPRNTKAGVNCQMQMAQMLTMVGGDEERQIGFKPAERQSTSKAWDHTIRFSTNAKKEKLESDIFSYLMLFIALALVMAVVCKQSAFPPKPKVRNAIID